MFPAIILPLLLLLLLRVIQVRNEFYKDSQGVLLVYDVGLRESFDALDSWLGEMKQEMGSQANMDSIVFIVCANKVRLTGWLSVALVQVSTPDSIEKSATLTPRVVADHS